MRVFSHLILIPVLLAMSGCKTATGIKPMTVEVRDRDSQQPVEGAVVSAAVAHLFVPYEPGLTSVVAYFDANPRLRTSAVTDTAGVARLDAAENCPVKIVIARAGYEPLETYLRVHPAQAGPSEWIDPDAGIGSASGLRLQARFAP